MMREKTEEALSLVAEIRGYSGDWTATFFTREDGSKPERTREIFKIHRLFALVAIYFPHYIRYFDEWREKGRIGLDTLEGQTTEKDLAKQVTAMMTKITAKMCSDLERAIAKDAAEFAR